MSVVALKPVYKPTLEQQVESFRDLDREFKKLEKIHAAAKKAIVEAMGSSKQVFNDKGHLIAEVTEYTQSRFDAVAFKLSNPDLHGLYEKVITCTKFGLK